MSVQENMIVALSTATLLEEIVDQRGTLHTLSEYVILQAVKALHDKERQGLMHLSKVQTIHACDIQKLHPQCTIVCRHGSNGLAK
eukprot:5849464-Prorocentrum_lima.AAC.1